MINRIVETAQLCFASIKPKGRKKKQTVDSALERVAHDIRVENMDPDTVLCYSDGSASPNPGPCGAGVSMFTRGPNSVFDYGASLGRGTNNFAELFGLGIIFTELIVLQVSNTHLKKAVVFCDSKLALRAASSRRKPITNCSITRALRVAFQTVSKCFSMDLQWIRGHVDYGGNERVDRISKAFASSRLNKGAFDFDGDFTCQSRRSDWLHSYPLTDVPAICFISNLLHPVDCFTHVSKRAEVDAKSNVSTSNFLHTPSTGPSNSRKRKFPQIDKFLVSNEDNGVGSSVRVDMIVDRNDVSMGSSIKALSDPSTNVINFVTQLGSGCVSYSNITSSSNFTKGGAFDSPSVGLPPVINRKPSQSVTSVTCINNLIRPCPPFVSLDSDKNIGANVTGLRKSARISQKLSISAQSVIREVPDLLPTPTFVSHHRSDCLGKRKRPVVDIIAQPTLLSPETGPAFFTSSVDNFDSQTIPKSKPSGVWKIFEGIRTVNLGKRKRASVYNFKSHTPLSPQCGPGHFLSSTVNFQPLNILECKPSGVACSSDVGLTAHWTDHDVKHDVGEMDDVGEIDYLRRTEDGDSEFKLSPTNFPNNDLSVLTDRVSKEFTPKCMNEITSTRHDGDPVHDSPAQVYLRHADGDLVANFTRSSDISTSLSVTSDRELNEPTLMRANTLTANISLIDGTNVGNGVPDDDL